MGVDAENFLESIYDSVIETKSSSDAEMTKNGDGEESKDADGCLVKNAVKAQLDEDKRVLEERIQPCIEKILDAIYKEALHRKSESDLLAQFYK